LGDIFFVNGANIRAFEKNVNKKIVLLENKDVRFCRHI